MQKEQKNIYFEVKNVQEDGTFQGMASTFDREPDSYGDVVAKGAFQKSLMAGGRNRNGQIPMHLNHDSSKIPGIWEQVYETEQGLSVSGRLAIKTNLGRDVYELLKIGAKLSLSIGYSVVDFSYDRLTKIRTLKEVELFEISIVSTPAKITASIDSFKNHSNLSFGEQILQACKELNRNTWPTN